MGSSLLPRISSLSTELAEARATSHNKLIETASHVEFGFVGTAILGISEASRPTQILA